MNFSAGGLLLSETDKQLLRLERDEPITGAQLPFLRAITQQAIDRAVADEIRYFDVVRGAYNAEGVEHAAMRAAFLDEGYAYSPAERLTKLLLDFEFLSRAK